MQPVSKFSLAACFALVSIIAQGERPAQANDTMAELKTGGLVFTRSPDISMDKEDLYISPTEVKVDYLFRNNADHDIDSVIAFPMPDISGGVEDNIAMTDTENDNFLGFSVTQDNKPIVVNLQQRAIVNGIDMTDAVKAAGIPMLPQSEKTAKALEAMSEAAKADFLSSGLIMIDRYDVGKGMEDHPIALWTLKSTYWWKTTFPAGRSVKVSHHYKPSVGGTVGVTFTDNSDGGERLKEYQSRYCVDEDFVKLAKKMVASQKDGMPTYVENWISYILTTGSNWYGPIKSFHLTVDKGNPKNYVSFCGEGVKKTSATRFEIRAEDFYPDKDINILLLVPVE